jgi:hypothetical protein
MVVPLFKVETSRHLQVATLEYPSFIVSSLAIADGLQLEGTTEHEFTAVSLFAIFIKSYEFGVTKRFAVVALE